MGLALTLGGVQFQDFEIPEDFGPLGGKQVVVTHEFPGGLITQQEFGAFPIPVSWKGYLTGANAFDRQQTLDQIRVAGDDVQLAYGRYVWLGKVTEFEAKAKHQYLVPYTIKFEPSQDLSGAGGTMGAGPDSDLELSDETAGVNDVADGASGLTLPAPLSDPATALTAAVQTALSNGNGTVAGISTADAATVQAAVAAAQAAALPLISSADPTQSSPASDLYAYATNIGATVATPTSPQVQFQAINPNLFSIAVQYFKDATKWQDIADASGLADPQPIGSFTITVPNS